MPSPLIENMIEQYHYPVVDEPSFESFIQSQPECVLFFTENPERFPESNDVAMILPELVKAFDGIAAAVVAFSISRSIRSSSFRLESEALTCMASRARTISSVASVNSLSMWRPPS